MRRLGVAGAGAMGTGIAQVAARAGLEVVLWNRTPRSFDEPGVRATSDLAQLAQCDFVIESVVEDRTVKRELLQALDALLPLESILCTNTSSISITELAAYTRRPDRFAGMHFAYPVPRMVLVEGIRGLATSDETFAVVRTLAKRLGKTLIEAKDRPGFVVNRILMALVNEAFFALEEEAATARDLDAAARLGGGLPMGPLELADFLGLDTVLAVFETLHRDLADSKYRPAPLLRRLVQAGRLGRKTRRGVYEY